MLETIVKLIVLLVFIGIVRLLTKIISRMLPDRFKNGKIAPRIKNISEKDERSVKLRCMECSSVFTERELQSDVLFCASCGGRLEIIG
jgi:Zn finger protein HypA/HybF involved in hydrogenase expression